MTTIEIVGGTMLVDEVDRPLALSRRWRVSTNGYAKGSLGGRDVHFHRCLFPIPARMEIDHINGDKLDNRRCNLRLATRAQNAANRRLGTNNTSGFRGVSWEPRTRRWRAAIYVHSTRIRLGEFKDPIAAARAYNAAAAKYYGDFARLNPVPEVEEP